MIAIYLSWDKARNSVIIDPGSPISRVKIEESKEIQQKLYNAVLKLHAEWKGMPFVVREVNDKGYRLPVPRGMLSIEIVVHAMQRELGPDFNVSEKP